MLAARMNFKVNAMARHNIDSPYPSSQISNNNLIHPTVAWALVIAVALLLFPVAGVNYGPDAHVYLGLAIDFVNGQPYTGFLVEGKMSRAPGFSYVIAGVMSLFDGDVVASAYVPRFIFAISLLLLFAFTKRLYSSNVGLFAVLFASVLSIFHHYHASLSIDIVLPPLIMGAALCLWHAFKGNRYALALAGFAGLLVAGGFLIKEVAILFFPLPITIFILVPEFRKRKNLALIIVFYIALAVGLAPWVIYALSNGTSLMGLLGSDVQFAARSEGRGGLAGLFAKWLPQSINALSSFIPKYIIKPFSTVGAVFAISLLAVLYRAIFFKDTEERFLVAVMVHTLPLALFVSMLSLRVGQNLILYSLLLVSIGAIIKTVQGFAAQSRFDRLAVVASYATDRRAIALAAVLVLALSLNTATRNNYSRSSQVAYTYWMGDAFNLNQLSLNELKAGQWLQKNAEMGSVVYAHSWGYSLIRSSVRGTAKVHRGLPGRTRAFLFNRARWVNAYMSDGTSPIFLIGQNAPACRKLPFERRSSSFKCLISVFNETSMLDKFRENKATHVVISKPVLFLRKYFDHSPSFTLVASFLDESVGAPVYVYEIGANPAPALDFKPWANEDFYSLLDLMKKEDPQGYDDFVRETLINGLGLPSDFAQRPAAN